jgi:hypothetical protein
VLSTPTNLHCQDGANRDPKDFFALSSFRNDNKIKAIAAEQRLMMRRWQQQERQVEDKDRGGGYNNQLR